MPVAQKHICTYLCQAETAVHLCCDMYIVKILLQSKMSFPNDNERQDVDIVRQCA